MELVEREIDAFGRIVIPKLWRKNLGTHIVLFKTNEEITLKPQHRKKFSELKIALHIRAPLEDWQAVKKELWNEIS